MDWGEMILFPLMSPGGTRAFTRLNPVAMFSLALFSFLSGVGVVWLFFCCCLPKREGFVLPKQEGGGEERWSKLQCIGQKAEKTTRKS